MAKGKVLSQMKSVIYSLMDNNGNFRVTPVGDLRNMKISEDRLLFMRSFITLCLRTDYLRLETRMYLSDEGISMSKVSRNLSELPENEGKVLNERVTFNKIYYDQRIIERDFGVSVVYDVLYSDKPIKDYEEILGRKYVEFGECKLSDLITLDLPTDCICTELGEDKLEPFLARLKVYSAATVVQTENEMEACNRDEIGYLNYLMGSPCLSSVDKRRKDIVMSALKIPDTPNVE